MKLKVEVKTIGTADLKRIHYAMTLLLFNWQTQHFIRTALCQADHFFLKKFIKMNNDAMIL